MTLRCSEQQAAMDKAVEAAFRKEEASQEWCSLLRGRPPGFFETQVLRKLLAAGDDSLVAPGHAL